MIKKIYRALRMELREHKTSFGVYVVLCTIVIAVLCFQLYSGNFESAFLCVLTLALLILPSLAQLTLRIEFPTVLEIILLLFIFAAEILGEIHEFYIIFPFWDTLLHTLNGFLAAAIGFSLVNLLNKSEKLVFQLSPLFTSIVSFCFSMTIGVIWEIFEFAMDQIFLFDMQKDTVVHQISSVTLDPQGRNIPWVISSIENTVVQGKELGLGGYLDIGLIDTMQDLIVNFIGATIFSVIGYFYVKNQGKNKFIKKLIPHKKGQDKDFLKMVDKAKEL